MSTGIEIKVWLQDEQESSDQMFVQIIQAIASSPRSSGSWTSFSLYDTFHRFQSPLFQVQDEMSTDQLCMLIEQKGRMMHLSGKEEKLFGEWTPGSPCLSARTTFSYKVGEEDTAMGMTVTCWDRASLKEKEQRYWEGDASIYLWRLWPFVKNIEQNVDLFLDFLARLVEKIQPVSIKVFNEDREYFLLNAHLAYYSDEASIANDLEFISHLYEHGLPTYALSPLKSSLTLPLREVSHEEKENALEQWTLLQQLLTQKPVFSKDLICLALESNAFDIYRLPVGYLILSAYPDCFKAYLDRFYFHMFKVCVGR